MTALSPTSTGFISAFFFSSLLYLVCSCTNASGSGNKPQLDSHQKMIELLAATKVKMDRMGNTYSAEPKIAFADSLLLASKDPNQQMNAMFEKAGALLEYGDEAQAVGYYERLMPLVANDPNAQKQLLMSMGMAYLRLGERNNCVNVHGTDACVMPIQGNGVHQNKTGAQKSVEVFESLLKLDPQNMDARWLLNIAYMTLGEYPGKVPKTWLIPGLDDQGKVKVKPFVDMAIDAHVAINNRAGGSVVEDFNNDGLLDLITTGWGLDDPMHYFINKGDGTFTDASKSSRLGELMGGLNMVQADYNNDGWMDIFVLRGAWQGQTGFGEQPNSLIRNNGDGTFTDVTTEAGVLTYRPTQTATWNDFNRDGWIDLFVGNESTDPQHVYPCELYINNKNGTFTNIAGPQTLDISAFVKGVNSGDFDKDGWPDLMVSTLKGQRILLRNRGLGNQQMVGFENVSQKAGFTAQNYPSFSTWFFDYDNDGWLDVLACDYDFNRALSFYAAQEALGISKEKPGRPHVFHNNHDGTFTDVSEKLGLNRLAFSMGSNFGDINNDGWLDFYLATGNPDYKSLIPNKLYLNMEGKGFADVTATARVGNLQKGHGVSFADIDNDGDQDIHVDLGGAYRGDAYPNSLYVNPGQSNNHWLYLQLQGTKTNRAGIGAKLTLRFHENGKERMIYRELNSGSSFGCSPMRREIGVGQATVIDEITISWPVSGMIQTFKNVQVGQYLKIVEGQEKVEVLPLKRMEFKHDPSLPLCAPTK